MGDGVMHKMGRGRVQSSAIGVFFFFVLVGYEYLRQGDWSTWERGVVVGYEEA